MKAILIAIILLLSSQRVEEVPAIEFLQGLLDGLNLKVDTKSIVKCMNGLEPAFNKVLALIEKIKVTDPNDMPSLIFDVLEAGQNIFQDILPCMTCPDVIRKILQILNVDLNKRYDVINSHLFELIGLFIELSTQINYNNIYGIGRDMGEIIYILALADSLRADDVLNFLVGFFSEADPTIDAAEVEKCMENDDLITDLQNLVNDIKTTNWNNMLNVISTLVEIWSFTKEFTNDMRVCESTIPQLKVLLDAIAHLNINSILPHVIANIQQITRDGKYLVADVLNGNFTGAGVDIGNVVKILIGKKQVKDSSALSFVTGLLEGLRIGVDVNNLVNCVNNITPLINNVKDAISKLEHIDFKHMDTIIEGLQELVASVVQILNDLKPCIASPQDIEKLIEAFSIIGWAKIPARVLTHISEIVSDVSEIKNGFGGNDYETAGKGVGDLLYVIFLS